MSTILPSGNYEDMKDDNYDQVLNDNTIALIIGNVERSILETIFYVTLCGGFGLLGIGANVINIVVFYKQGFGNTANIAFFGLAISDLLCILFVVWMSVCMNPVLFSLGVPWYGVEVMYVTAGWPHNCFGRITSNITVYITAERCLSIAFPLKIKEIVTKAKTIVTIIVIYCVNIMTLATDWATYVLGWKFVPEYNKTLIAIIFNSSRKSVGGITFVLHSMISMVSFFGVICFTVVLIIKLRESSQMRKNMTSDEDHKGSISIRDKKTVKMVVLIASILIVCYTPGAMAGMTVFIVGSEFNIQGRYINICSVLWGIACSCQAINSSVNIFLYYKMSSKYRQTLHNIFKVSRGDVK